MKKIKNFFPFILLAIIVFLSLGKTLQYYFYSDDFAFIYYLQNNRNFESPYDMVSPIFAPIYKLFGERAILYFALGIFTYLLASIAVYLFIKKLTNNKLIALLSSLVFATGYIGIDQFTMIAVSIVGNINIINICLTLILLLTWISSKKLRYYFLTLIMFWVSLRVFPYKAFPLILFVPTLGFIISFKFDRLLNMVRKLTFFIITYIPFYIIGTRLIGTGAVGGSQGIITRLNVDFLKEFFAVLGRFILINPVSGFLHISTDQSIYAFAGFIFFIIIVIASLFFSLGKNLNYGRSLLAVLLLTMEGYFGNMILTASFDSNGPVNRYLTISFMSFSAIFPLFLFIILKKGSAILNFKWMRSGLILIILILPFALMLMLESRKYEDDIIFNRSKPANAVFKSLKANIPELSEYTVFYFDKGEYYPVSSQFGNVLLSAAMDKTVNLAVPYKAKIDSIKIPDTFDEFLYMIKDPPVNKKVSYDAFYYDEKGLQNTTDKIFTLLKNGKITNISDGQIQYKSSKGLSEITVNTRGVSSLTPLKVKFDLKVDPLDASSFEFPYAGIESSSDVEKKSVKEYFQKNSINKDKVFEYLLSRKKYYSNVKVDVESIHIGKQNPGELLIDGKPDTYWLSDQSRWEVNIKPWIRLDLGEERNISRLLWRQMSDRVITEYTIFTSIDGKIWKKVSNLRQSKILDNENLLINDFTHTYARYIKLDINKIENNLSPGLVEIEAIESEFTNIDLALAFRIKDNPFEYIKDSEELVQAYDYIRENAKLRIKVVTNKNDPASDITFMKLPIIVDGAFHKYEFQIPAGGTQLKNIKFESNFPADFNLENIIFENLSKEVLYKQIEEKCMENAEVEDYASSFICK